MAGKRSGTAVAADRPVLYLTGFVIVLALLLGGATRQGVLADAVVELLSLPLLGLLAIRFVQPGRLQQTDLLWPGLLIAAGLVLGLIQLIPLPPAVWASLPGREPVVAVWRAAGAELPWMPLSLDPDATVRCLFSVVPAVIVFFATTQLDWAQRRLVSLIIVGFGLLSVLVGLAQLAGGSGSALRIHGTDSDVVGFFANRNHYAALLYSVIPLATAWAIGFVHQRKIERVVALAAILAVVPVLVLGLGLAHSRAGIALAAMAAICAVGMSWEGGERYRLTAILLVVGGLVVGAFLVGEYALGSLLDRFDADITKDLRLVYVQQTLIAISHYFPFGSGLGTFVPIYALFENEDLIRSTYANHAHNDWLELFLELGAFGLLLMAGFLFWVCLAVPKAWTAAKERFDPTSAALSRAGAVIVVLLLVHSLVDYPLRTTALSVLFGFATGLMISPPRSRQSARSRSAAEGESGAVDRGRTVAPLGVRPATPSL